MTPAKSHDRIDFVKFREYLKQLAELQLHQNVRRRVDASDVVQATLLEAYRNRETLRHEDSAAIAGWLRSMLNHNITDAVRHATRERRDVRRETSLDPSLPRGAATPRALMADQSSPSQSLVRDELCASMAVAIGSLPPDQREAVVLHHLHGLPLRELARQMNRSEPSVAGLLFRAMKRLRECMLREAGEG